MCCKGPQKALYPHILLRSYWCHSTASLQTGLRHNQTLLPVYAAVPHFHISKYTRGARKGEGTERGRPA